MEASYADIKSFIYKRAAGYCLPASIARRFNRVRPFLKYFIKSKYQQYFHHEWCHLIRFFETGIICWLFKSPYKFYATLPLIHTPHIQTTRLFFLPFSAYQIDWALSQSVDVIFLETHFTSSSVAWRTVLIAHGAWVRGITKYHVTVKKNKWMICNKLESFQTKPLDTGRGSRMVLQGCITWASKKMKSIKSTTEAAFVTELIVDIKCMP